MTLKNLILIFISISIFSCTENNSVDVKPTADNQIDTNENSATEKVNVTQEYNDGGPPFSDTCACSFDIIADIKSNENRQDLILSGKDWNPDFYSCSWTWGEFINNESPTDTMIKDFRIHLIDLEKINGKVDFTFLNSKEFNENLIATYSKSVGEKYMTCKFDPNKTGKYPKPKQWVD